MSETGSLNTGSKLDVARKAFSLHEHIDDFQRAISSIANCQKPVIAAIHGLCIGLGVDISSACDIRLAAENAIFSIAEVNVGLAADIGTLQRFPKIIGNDSTARELALTGRKFGADEALRIGFISQVVKGSRLEVEEAAIKLAREIARKSPIAVLGTKRIMNFSRDHSVQEGLDYTAAWNMSMLQSQDMQESLQAWGSKGKPARYANLNGVISRL